MERVRCYVENEETAKIEKVFKSFTNYSTDYSSLDFDLYGELNDINAMCKFTQLMFVHNDFKASSMAYMYVLPRIEKFVNYLAKGVTSVYDKKTKTYKIKEEINFELKHKREAFRSETSKISVVKNSDGSSQAVSNFEYVYRYLRNEQMGIAGRYFIHYNLQYLEKDKSKKAYPKRQRVLKSAVWWFNQMLLGKFDLSMPDSNGKYDFIPRKIIFSTFPSSGKSFLCNTMNEMFTELEMIIHRKGGVLRVSNEQGNIFRQSRQTMNLILNTGTLVLYPENRDFINKNGMYNPFNKGSEEEWGLIGCDYEPNTSIFKTRDSAINSVRCQLGMFDDPSRGMQESTNIGIHTKICNLFNGDFMDRFEDEEEQAIILTGTMFNPFDVFSTEIQKAIKDGFTRDDRFLNTFISEDKTTVIIVNDCEDEYGESAFPEFITTKELMRRKESLPLYDYSCIWRQKPIPADGLTFSKEYLTFYDELPPESELSSYAYASLDPTRRKPNDFLSMPVFRYHEKTNKYYMVNAIYKRKSVLDLYGKIVSNILGYRIVKFVYEENTDTSLGVALKSKIKEKDDMAEKWCNMTAVFNSKNKLQRITDMADTIKQFIVFPSEKYANAKTEMGFAVHNLLQFDGKTSDHDDFPDSLAIFAEHIILNKKHINVLKTHKNLPI